MIRKTLFSLILFCVIKGLHSQSIYSYLSQINATVATIPYIFEGQPQSVEVFAGDDFGNKLPWSAAVWNGGIGYFYDQYGKEAKGYSLAKIKICKVYKGSINPERYLEVLTKSFAINDVYLVKIGTGSTADTVLQFQETPPSSDQGAYPLMLPSNSYPKNIYFCDRINTITSTAYANKEYYSNFHSQLQMPFNQPIYIDQPDGSKLYKIAYCALIPYAFDDQTQLQAFLNQIQTINPNPADFCRTDSKDVVNVNEIEKNEFNVAVYPNPSNAAGSIKIKFNLDDESPVTFILTDIAGKQILTKSLGSQKSIDYDLHTDVQSGIYFLNINIGQKKQSFKIIKN